jgi:hypothetical protein
MSTEKKRLEYLRTELRSERISYGELIELQSLAEHIEDNGVELLEAAGVPENWTVEKKDEIERILIDKWATIGMDVPANFEEIVQYCYKDVCETAGPINWSDSDVSIAFRRWIESKTK